ncbi:MAG: helix-turn-helix transcriptional regulator [Lentisphaeria bacterium]|nr:helix-turn-helix transcriptional regulator [Lentisphaeria bacterium]
MEWFNFDIEHIPREENFPFRVVMLYSCNDVVLKRIPRKMPGDRFEINIRLRSDDSVCTDILDGTVCNQPFPNVICKLPDLVWEGRGGARSTIAFAYSSETLAYFRMLGMIPEHLCRSFAMTPGTAALVEEFNRLRMQLYSPGTADRIDWICFRLFRELYLRDHPRHDIRDDREKIKNLSIWFQLHYNKSFNIEDIARAHGYSRASFFRKWKETFDTTPTQYLIDLKLTAAARLLSESTESVSGIAGEVNFSGLSAFYRRFAEKYGCTPDVYRKKMQN